MKISTVLTLCAATTLSLAAAATTPTPTPTIAPDCTQTQRQQINKLLQQNVNPAKACYAKASGDITILSTSRLCPLEECRVWLAYMAANTPVCMFDVTNYGRDFRTKNKDCLDPDSSASGSGADEAATPKPTLEASGSSSDVGSEAGATTAPPETPEPTLESSGSGSSFVIEPIETTESPEVTFPPETTAPRTAAPVTSSAVTLVSACATAMSVAVAVTALVL